MVGKSLMLVKGSELTKVKVRSKCEGAVLNIEGEGVDDESAGDDRSDWFIVVYATCAVQVHIWSFRGIVFIHAGEKRNGKKG